MKKTVILLLLILLPAMIFSACGERSEDLLAFSDRHRIIFDTDAGADDAMALMMLCKAENIDILGVTVLAGNVDIEQGAKNMLSVLELTGKTDIPVYKGSTVRGSGEYITPFSVFGADGMGDQGLVHPESTPAEGDAIDHIIKTVAENPGEVEIITAGPMTNIAGAIKKDPVTMAKVKRIWSMGTGGAAMQGNASPVAEFNVYLDAQAYAAVIEFGVPLTVIGNDMCYLPGVRISQKNLDEFAQCGECGEFLSKCFTEVLDYYHRNGLDYAVICDPIAAATVIWSDFMTGSGKYHAETVTEECAAYGSVIFFKEGMTYDAVNYNDFNTDLVIDIAQDKYLESVKALIR